jgi:lysozyme
MATRQNKKVSSSNKTSYIHKLVNITNKIARSLSKSALILFGILFTILTIIVVFYFKKPALFFPKWQSYKVYGIDVSKYQRNINWNEVKKDGIEFAFIKATEGRGNEDRNFEDNWEDCKKANIIRGAYHFFRPQVKWQGQFENFTKKVHLERGDLPPVIDIEDNDYVSKELLLKNLKPFVIALEKHYGMKPIIYSYENFYNDYFQNEFRNYNLWIANYASSEPELNDGAKWEFWQYTEDGSIIGVKGYVDLNCFYGTESQLAKLLKK